MEQKKQTTILIADDSCPARNLLRDILVKDGYQVLFAENGKNAFHMAKKVVPDLIILDILDDPMSVWDSLKTCRRLKADASTANIPVIFVPNRSSMNAIREVQNLGCLLDFHVQGSDLLNEVEFLATIADLTGTYDQVPLRAEQKRLEKQISELTTQLEQVNAKLQTGNSEG